ncbi:MAG: D-2-hydroxyacid dehydrogenase [Pseudomonadota bacterium]
MKDRMNHLLILSEEAPAYLDLLQAAKLTNLRITALSDTRLARTKGAECNMVLGEPGLVHGLLPYMTNLEWVQSTWAGVEPCIQKNSHRDYQLTNVKGIFGAQMSEYVFCYILMHEKLARVHHKLQQQKRWEQHFPGQLRGKTIGIMGVGSIGSHLAQTARYFQMQTKGYTFSSTNCEFIERYYHGEELVEFVSDLDYLVNTLPDTPQTTHLINDAVLRAMPPGAILINIGRGNVIEESALIDALNQQTIAGAVLDVFAEEPLPEDHRLWQTPNMTITAHISVISYPEDVVPVFIDNYHRFSNGQDLKYSVDFERGY